MKGQSMRDVVITEADTCREFVTHCLGEIGALVVDVQA